MDKRGSICTHPDLREKIAHPGKVFLYGVHGRIQQSHYLLISLVCLTENRKLKTENGINAPFRILTIPHQFSCGYSVSYIRKRSASIRRASAQDAARDACKMRRDPAHPVRPWEKTLKKG
jgi:hypothetical protein